jgi:hypothetical protein
MASIWKLGFPKVPRRIADHPVSRLDQLLRRIGKTEPNKLPPQAHLKGQVMQQLTERIKKWPARGLPRTGCLSQPKPTGLA